MLKNQVTVVVRASGERTTQAAAAIVSQQVHPDNVTIISEAPFHKTLRRTYQHAIEQGRKWVVVVDADVLLRSGAIETMVEQAEAHDDNLVVLQATCWDKLFGGPKPTPPYIYRVTHLSESLKHIPAVEEGGRPETTTNRRMEALGYSRIVLEDVVLGLHDHEQYYRDVFRTPFNHAHKHRRYGRFMKKLWSRQAEHDPDFQIALIAFAAGDVFDTEILLDRRMFPSIDALLTLGQLEEKSADCTMRSPDVDQMLATFDPSPEYRHMMALRDGTLNNTSLPQRAKRKLKSLFQRI